MYFNTLIELLGDSYRWLLVGLLFAALVQTYVPTDFLQQWGKGFWGMLLMVVIGVPMYICATASTPVAAGLILAGVSPGAALVFMLAGPATNIATLMMVRREFGTTSLLIYLLSLASSAIAFGLGLDALLAYQDWSLGLSAVATQSHQLSIWAQGIAGLLALLMLYTAWQEWQQSRSSI